MSEPIDFTVTLPAWPSWTNELDPNLSEKLHYSSLLVIIRLFSLGNDGNGFHQQLLGVANSLKKHFSKEESFILLRYQSNTYKRHVPDREIEEAISKAFDESTLEKRKQWGAFDPDLVAEIVSKSTLTTPEGLTAKFGLTETSAEVILGNLFSNDELLCLGLTPYKFDVGTLKEHLDDGISNKPFIVPSPMKSESGITKSGKESPKCNDNTGPRRYLVIEFDRTSESEQSAIIEHLSSIAPLKMIVHSGGKSLHAWFYCEGVDEAILWQFMNRAIRLGADTVTWTPSQFVRTPGGTRDNGAIQRVIAFRGLAEADMSLWTPLPSHDKSPSPPGTADGILEPKGALLSFPIIRADKMSGTAEPDDFVEGLLTEGAASVVYGSSNTGKSFWVLDLASAVATGSNFRDELEVDQGAVVYVALEGSHGAHNRIAALKQAGKIQDGTPLFLCFDPVSLLEPGHAAKLAESVKQAAEQSALPCRLVILDTLARAMAGGDENKGQDMTLAVKAVDLIRATTSAHVMLVHHCGKDEAKGARGHSSLRAAMDTEIEISRADGESVTTVRVSKQRDMEKGGPLAFSLKVIELGLNKRGKPITSCVVKHESSEMAASREKPGRKLKIDPRILLTILPQESSVAWQKVADSELKVPPSSFYRYKDILWSSGAFRETPGGGVEISFDPPPSIL